MNDIQNSPHIIYDNENDNESNENSDIENDESSDIENDENSDIGDDENGNLENNESSDIENELDDSSLKEIYSGQTFTSFEVLEKCLKRYAKKTGFEIRTTRCEKENGSWTRKSYKCHHGGKYKPKKNVDPTHNRNQNSARIKCGFLINAAYRKRPNLVFINKFISEHNHVLQSTTTLQEFSPVLRKIPDHIMEEIQFYVQECHLGTTVLKRILRSKYPDQDIYSQDLYSAVCRFKSNIQVKNDAATLIEHLKKLHEEDPEWYYQVDFEGIDNRLSKIFWMSPEQRRMWSRYHDVVINDNTCKTNKYLMPLSVFIIIDSDQRSRIVATAVVCDETVSAYEWILEQTMRATGDLQPTIIFTDADPAMQVAINNQYPKTIVRHCAFHIRQNLVKKIKKKLNSKWDDFIGEFYALRNSHVISDFEDRWTELMGKYPEIQKYCERVLYPTKTCWAYGFIRRSFLANTHSTQRVESMNRIIKMEANSGCSLCQLHSIIELRLKDEAKYSRLQEFRNMNPTTGMPLVSNTIFKSVDEICKKYLTSNSLALQRKQMVEALLYRTWIKKTDNMAIQNENQYNIGFIEDDYEEPQILLNMALDDCSDGIIKEIWEVKHIQSTTNRSQFVILLDDGTHYCTCLYLIYAGFVCRHFFAVILQSKMAQFNIKLIPSRWYSENGLATANKVMEKSIQLIQNKENEEQETGTFFMMNNLRGQDVYNDSIKCLDSKKVQYGHGLGLCKKALNMAIENKSCQAFEELLKQFIETQMNIQNDASSETTSFNIENPLQHKGKGRPSNKRYLSAIENNSSNKSNNIQEEIPDLKRKRNKRQCSTCKSWYHDSRNCPEKNKIVNIERDKENV